MSVKDGLFVLMIAAMLGSVAAPSDGCEMNSATDSDAGKEVASSMAWVAGDATDSFRLGAVDFGSYASSRGPELAASDGALGAGGAQAASFDLDVDSLSPDVAPTGAKVPEPATLALLGTGLIGIASAVRIKRRPQGFLPIAWARMGSAAQP